MANIRIISLKIFFNYVQLVWSRVHVRFNRITNSTNPFYIGIDYCQVRDYQMPFQSKMPVLKLCWNAAKISSINRHEIWTEFHGFSSRRINYEFSMPNSLGFVNMFCIILDMLLITVRKRLFVTREESVFVTICMQVCRCNAELSNAEQWIRCNATNDIVGRVSIIDLIWILRRSKRHRYISFMFDNVKQFARKCKTYYSIKYDMNGKSNRKIWFACGM